VSFIDTVPQPNDFNFELLRKYRRKQNDLIYVHTLTLKQAINCEPIRIPTLDGRTLLVPVDEIVNPKTVKKIDEEGMPIHKKHSNIEDDVIQKGNLYIQFNIEFPKTLREH